MLEWKRVPCSGDAPSPRKHSFVHVLPGDVGARLYVLGGRNLHTTHTDIHTIDLTYCHWICAETRGNAPSTLSKLTSNMQVSYGERVPSVPAGANQFVTFAGHPFQFFRNTIHSLDPRTMRWSEHAPRWNHPTFPSTHGVHHMGTPWRTSLSGPVVFGAEDGCFSNTVYGLEMRMWRWYTIEAGGPLPCPRSCHSHRLMHIDDSEDASQLIIFGGLGKTLLNDAYALNLLTCTFTKFDVPPSVQPRSSAELFEIPGGVVIHGGNLLGGSTLHDMQALTGVNAEALSNVFCGNPLQRAGHTIAKISPTQFYSENGIVPNLVSFGGHDGSTYYSDLNFGYWNRSIR